MSVELAEVDDAWASVLSPRETEIAVLVGCGRRRLYRRGRSRDRHGRVHGLLDRVSTISKLERRRAARRKRQKARHSELFPPVSAVPRGQSHATPAAFNAKTALGAGHAIHR
jgi:hypothetical protein